MAGRVAKIRDNIARLVLDNNWSENNTSLLPLGEEIMEQRRFHINVRTNLEEDVGLRNETFPIWEL